MFDSQAPNLLPFDSHCSASSETPGASSAQGALPGRVAPSPFRREAFLSSTDVRSFIDWFAAAHSDLVVDLSVKHSYFVPGGIQAKVVGLGSVLEHYRWRARGGATGSWSETLTRMRVIDRELALAIDTCDSDKARQVCIEILRWGGDRNALVGALPFLSELHKSGTLATYLHKARAAFALNTAVADDRHPQFHKMNAMLAKVTSRISLDGLPIVDSRVAAASATLVELWRRHLGIAGPFPAELTFPATAPSRTVRHLFADAPNPGVMSYAPSKTAQTAGRWCSAQIRLGWLLSALLENAPSLFADQGDLKTRMHALEATLFMIGYDVTSLRRNWPIASPA